MTKVIVVFAVLTGLWLVAGTVHGTESPDEIKALDAMLKHYDLELPRSSKRVGLIEEYMLLVANIRSVDTVLDQIRQPQAEIVRYWAMHMLDEEFAGEIKDILEKAQIDSEKIRGLSSNASMYQLMSQDANAIRYHTDFTSAQKTELMRRADVPGRLNKVQKSIIEILKEIGYLNPHINRKWKPVYSFLKADLTILVDAAFKVRESQLDMFSAMKDAMWGTVDKGNADPQELEEAYRELKRLHAKKASAFLAFVANGLRPDLPIEALENDVLLNAHLDAVITYDQKVIQVFNLKTIKEKRGAQIILDGIFHVRRSIRRRLILLRKGRRLFTGSILTEIAEMSISGDRFTRSDAYIYQTLRYASMAVRFNPLNKTASQIVARAYKRLKELDPLTLTAVEFLRKGHSYALTGDHDKALETLAAGHLAYPDDEPLLQWYVVVSYVTNGMKSAEAIWRQKHAEAKKDSWFRNHTGAEVAYMVYQGLFDLAELAQKQSMLYATLKHYTLAYGAAAELKHYGYAAWAREEQEQLSGRSIELYKQLPLKPKPSDPARHYAAEAQDHLKRQEWQLAEEKYKQALEQAPWWPDGHYNLALIYGALYWPSPLAVREMELYLELAPNGAHIQEAREKLQVWNRTIREAVDRGAQVSDDLPMLIVPDVEGW